MDAGARQRWTNRRAYTSSGTSVLPSELLTTPTLVLPSSPHEHTTLQQRDIEAVVRQLESFLLPQQQQPSVVREQTVRFPESTIEERTFWERTFVQALCALLSRPGTGGVGQAEASANVAVEARRRAFGNPYVGQ